MRALTPIVLVLATILLNGGAAGAQSQPRADEHRALRAQLERDYDLVPLTDGVALRPKERGDVRLVEVTAGADTRQRRGRDRPRAARSARRPRRRGAAAVVLARRRAARVRRATGAAGTRRRSAGARTAARAGSARRARPARRARLAGVRASVARRSRENLRQRGRGPRRADRRAGGRGVRFGPGQWQGGRPGGRGHGLGDARRRMRSWVGMWCRWAAGSCATPEPRPEAASRKWR